MLDLINDSPNEMEETSFVSTHSTDIINKILYCEKERKRFQSNSPKKLSSSIDICPECDKDESKNEGFWCAFKPLKTVQEIDEIVDTYWVL